MLAPFALKLWRRLLGLAQLRGDARFECTEMQNPNFKCTTLLRHKPLIIVGEGRGKLGKMKQLDLDVSPRASQWWVSIING